jgi:hypothetical protein
MSFVVAGFGKFGRIALKRLRNSRPGVRIVVLEQDAARLKDVPAKTLTVTGDAAEIIADSSELEPDDIIIPMVPFNLAAEYVLRKRFGAEKTALPGGIAKLVPNPYVVDQSTLACSRADFICPDDCPEGELCTVTGESRVPLYDELRGIALPECRILVQQSSQILPGIGGYSLGSLEELVDQVGSGRNIIATSCKCHAILTCIEAQ